MPGVRSSGDDLTRALGPRVAHVTAAANRASIRANGLLPAAELARRSGAGTIHLRDRRMRLQGGGVDATLNHQRPILHYRAAADRVVEGYDAAGWAARLDERVFFWPERAKQSFAASLSRDLDTDILWIDTAALLDTCGDRLCLSPINSGNFMRGGARTLRGDWLYVPVSAGLDAFRENRRRRGLVKTPDRVAELSLKGGVDAATLRGIISIGPPAP